MDIAIHKDINLAPYCSMKVGGNAKYFIMPKTVDELLAAVDYFKKSNEKYIVVGNCSNLIFPDGCYDGGVICTTAIRGISINNGIIQAQCGETLSTLARFACDNSLTGLEFCYGIPGTIGGAVYMNAGAYGGDISQRFLKGTFLTDSGEIIQIANEDMGFGYRKSRLNNENLILLTAYFTAEIGDKESIKEKMDELMAKRKAAQPLDYPNSGSAYKRPEGHFAGTLIEQCGLKGFAVGGAKISEKHAGFIINYNNATATDVIKLLEKVADIVFENTGVRLEAEIKIIE